MANQGNQGNRDREGNLGQTGNDATNPTGTSGRQGTPEKESWQPGDVDGNRQTGETRRRNQAEDDDSPLGNRTTNR